MRDKRERENGKVRLHEDKYDKPFVGGKDVNGCEVDTWVSQIIYGNCGGVRGTQASPHALHNVHDVYAQGKTRKKT